MTIKEQNQFFIELEKAVETARLDMGLSKKEMAHYLDISTRSLWKIYNWDGMKGDIYERIFERLRIDVSLTYIGDREKIQYAEKIKEKRADIQDRYIRSTIRRERNGVQNGFTRWENAAI